MSILNNYPKRYIECKKNFRYTDLYRSYNKDILFIAGNKYEIEAVSESFIWIKNEQGYITTFRRSGVLINKYTYLVKEYFVNKYTL